MTSLRDIERLERVVALFDELQSCIARNHVTRDSIIESIDHRWMVSMPLYDITEQIARLSDDFINAYPINGFKSIVGMRNRISHGYDTVGFDFIADAVIDDLPELAKQCREILAEFQSGSRGTAL